MFNSDGLPWGRPSADTEDPVIDDQQDRRGQIKGAVTKNYVTVIHDTCLTNNINTINNDTQH